MNSKSVYVPLLNHSKGFDGHMIGFFCMDILKVILLRNTVNGSLVCSALVSLKPNLLKSKIPLKWLYAEGMYLCSSVICKMIQQIGKLHWSKKNGCFLRIESGLDKIDASTDHKLLCYCLLQVDNWMNEHIKSNHDDDITLNNQNGLFCYCAHC